MASNNTKTSLLDDRIEGDGNKAVTPEDFSLIVDTNPFYQTDQKKTSDHREHENTSHNDLEDESIFDKTVHGDVDQTAHNMEEGTQHDMTEGTQIVNKTHHLHVVDEPSEIDLDQDKKTAGNIETVVVDQMEDKDSSKLQTPIEKDFLTELSIPDVLKKKKIEKTSEKSIPVYENKEDSEIAEDLLHQVSKGPQEVLQTDVPESLTHNVESIEPQATQVISESQVHLEDAELSTNSHESSLNATPSHADLSVSARDILRRADQLTIAQDRIKELEDIVFSVRQNNEQLSSEIETLKQRIEQLTSTLDNTERRYRTKIESLSDERTLLEESLSQKNIQHNNLKLKIEELEKRLAKDLKSVRVTEKELENRLELLKQEKTTLLKSKDETILNLKRKIDHLMIDIDGYRKKSQSVQIQTSENEERIQRSVRALRLALGILEGSDPSFKTPKK